MQISEISAAALGGLRGLGLAQGDVEARATDAGVELTEAVSTNKLAPKDAPPSPAGSGSTNLDLTMPTLSPSVGAQTGLTGRKLTLDLDVKVEAAIKRPAAAMALAKRVKSLKGKVKVTSEAAKAIVKSIATASPEAAKEAAKALAPAVAASSAPAQKALTISEEAGNLAVNPLKKLLRSPWVWAGAGVLVLGVAFLFMRRRRGVPNDAIRQMASVQTQGLSRYDDLAGYVAKRSKSKRKAAKNKKSSKRKN